MKILLKNCTTAQGLKDILIEDDIYTQIETPRTIADNCADVVRDLSGMIIIPGVTDPHVHVRDLEQSDKEDWTTCSQAALNGGITTIFDMPNTIPATDDINSLNLKRQVAKKSKVNYKFFLGANNDNIVDLDNILSGHPNDIAGIKLFLAASSSNDIVDDRISITNLFRIALKYDVPVAVHTELQRCLNEQKKHITKFDATTHNLIRDRQCAIEGTEIVLEVAKDVGNKIVICHVSTTEELELIKKYKTEGTSVYCELTPHHLILNEERTREVGNIAKVNPPLRTKADNTAMLKAVQDGTIDFIGTDHAPHKLDEKNLEYQKAPSGFPGLETALIILVDLYQQGLLSLERLVQLTSSNANQLYKIENNMKIGNPTDYVIIDPDKLFMIEPEKFATKAKYSPFAGMKLKGKIIETKVNKRC